MLVIDPGDLARAAEAVMMCAHKAKDTQGHRIVWKLDGRQVEKAICAMLGMLTPMPEIDAVIPSNIQFCHVDKDGTWTAFPPNTSPAAEIEPIRSAE